MIQDYKYVSVTLLILCLQGVVYADVIQVYTLHNKEQCSRLCWYRAHCVAYSFTDDIITDGFNCLLHADPVTSMDIPNGWDTTAASNEGISNSCHVRHCAEEETCVPASTAASQHSCLTLPVVIDCGVPQPLDNSAFDYIGTGEGQVAILTCYPNSVWTPSDALPTVTCMANSEWTTLDGLCQQVEYDAPFVPFLQRLPWTISPGWNACVTGTFLGEGQMTFNFVSDQEDYPSLGVKDWINITLQVAFRDEHFHSSPSRTTFSRKLHNSWGTELHHVPLFPLVAGSKFTLTFHVNATHLSAALLGTGYTASFMWNGQVDLLSTVYLSIHKNVRLDYVNLISSAHCHSVV